MASNIPPTRLLLGLAAGAALTTACLAYTNTTSGNNPNPSLLASPTRHPEGLGLQNGGLGSCSLGSDGAVCLVDDGVNANNNGHMIWSLVQVASWALGCALLLWCSYRYSSVKEESDANKEESDASEKTSNTDKDVATSSTTAPIDSKCPIREKARKEGLVLYDGHWYQVAKFVPHHPGGDEVLRQYLGSDISFVVRVMHRKDVMKHRKPMRAASAEERRALSARREEVVREMIDDYRTNCSSATAKSREKCVKTFNLQAFEKEAHELYQRFVDRGYFKPTLFWLFHKTALVLLFLSLSITCMTLLPSAESGDSTPLSFILPGMCLGLFWHQSGYLMHDAEHHNLIGNERINDILGWMYGTVFLGVNGAWWREEHREHHALTNTFDDKGFKDPQMKEDVWIQHKKLIPFYGQEVIHFLANFQHILFIPIIFIAGRIGIVIDSTLTERKFRPWTILGNVLHLLLHYLILRQTSFPLRVYIMASFQQAILSLQLLGNHYTKPWNPVHAATEGNFFAWQVLCTQDFACSKWTRWYYGGLNFHYSHHVFPTLPREYFHITTPQIQNLCEKHGLPFEEVSFRDCVSGMVSNFNEVRKDFAKNGTGSLALMYT